jgi:hypothetical protein
MNPFYEYDAQIASPAFEQKMATYGQKLLI